MTGFALVANILNMCVFNFMQVAMRWHLEETSSQKKAKKNAPQFLPAMRFPFFAKKF